MASVADEAVSLDQGVQVVAAMLWKQGAGKLDGAKHLGPVIQAKSLKFIAQESIVEPRVVGDQDLSLQALE